MDAAIPDWVWLAGKLPIAFAQVREDPLLDLKVLGRIDRQHLRVMMVASGGCTAAMLAASNRLAELRIVDVNPAQLALTRVKLDLLQTAAPLSRAELLGHAFLEDRDRDEQLKRVLTKLELSRNALGPWAFVSRVGLDHAGRYECVFSQLRDQLRPLDWELIELLQCSDAARRVSLISQSTPLGQTFDEAFDESMALPNLVHLFGAQATQNSRQPFSMHFAHRTRQVISTLPTAQNPYLWQLLTGHFPDGISYPWIHANPPTHMPEVIVSNCTFDVALEGFENHFDFVHLSNILDWLPPEQARRKLQLAHRALRPGGYTLIRQLNSTLDIPSLDQSLQWLTDEANAMHANDRSFFYHAIHLGKKR